LQNRFRERTILGWFGANKKAPRFYSEAPLPVLLMVFDYVSSSFAQGVPVSETNH
jgi:hypothetical protein